MLGFLAIGSNIALMAVSAYLVSKAALVSNVAEVALVVTAVRVLAISRAAFRYLERYATHAATLRILADLRVWLYASIEPLAPARLTRTRTGRRPGATRRRRRHARGLLRPRRAAARRRGADDAVRVRCCWGRSRRAWRWCCSRSSS